MTLSNLYKSILRKPENYSVKLLVIDYLMFSLQSNLI